MPCVIAPEPTPPVLPSPFTITPPPLPPIPLNLNLCCKIVAFVTPTPSPPFPAGVSLVMGAIIDAMMGALEPYFDAIAIKCPKE